MGDSMGKKIGLAACLIMLAIEGTRSWAATDDAEPLPGPSAGPALQLSLKQAVDIALSPTGNARVQLAAELIEQARTRSAQARAVLLPNIDAAVLEKNQTVNLEVFGIQFKSPILASSISTFVGPFSVFDARATASQGIFDLSSILKYKAARSGINLAEAEKESTEDQTRDLVARAYLWGLRAKANLDAAQAHVQLSEALLKLAIDSKGAGVGTGIEVTRARVQLANERQRLLVAQNEMRRAGLQLLKVIGLDLGTEVELTDKLSLNPVAPATPEQALQVALQERTDWKAQQVREQTAQLTAKAVKMERLPSLYVFGDYGSSGLAVDDSVPTRTIGFQVRIPIFDGGRRDARRAESYSLWKQEGIRGHDLRAQIELDIRTSLDNLQSAVDQVKAAEEGLELATNELAQAERRYRAGVGSSIEVTDAQTRLERARDNHILALFNHSMARIDLGSATGTIRQMIQ